MGHLRTFYRGFCRWFGPVAGAIKGEVSKEERKRVLAKAAITYGTTWAGLKRAMHDADVVAEFFLPLATAAVVAWLETVSRKEQGEEKTCPDTPPTAEPSSPSSPASPNG